MAFPYFPICLLFSFLVIAWMMTTVTLIQPTVETDLLFHDEILNQTGVVLSEIGYIGGEITVTALL